MDAVDQRFTNTTSIIIRESVRVIGCIQTRRCCALSVAISYVCAVWVEIYRHNYNSLYLWSTITMATHNWSRLPGQTDIKALAYRCPERSTRPRRERRKAECLWIMAEVEMETAICLGYVLLGCTRANRRNFGVQNEGRRFLWLTESEAKV